MSNCDAKRQTRWPNQALQRAGAGRFRFMNHGFCNLIGFGGRALPAPVAELGRSAPLAP